MRQHTNPPGLDAIARISAADPGLRVSGADRRDGAAAARAMNDVIEAAIRATGVNRDGRIDPRDMTALSNWIRANPAQYDRFVDGHGDDERGVETGYHLLQGDGGTLKFQGRAFIDVVADAIYHVGFPIAGGRLRNEDGAANEKVDDVAGWMNFFVNGENTVHGTDGRDVLWSAAYSGPLKDAADETFLGGRGDDDIWAGDGDDVVEGGAGDDRSSGDAGDDLMSGGAGRDRFHGGAGDDTIDGGANADRLGGGDGADVITGGDGADTLTGQAGRDVVRGEAGNDLLYGGTGDDSIEGGTGNDKVVGETGHDFVRGQQGDDTLCGNDGDDTIFGGKGDDSVHGQAGDDRLHSGPGNDRVLGGEGRDLIDGGEGRDLLLGWEKTEAADVFLFEQGDSAAGARDVIRGVQVGRDKIDLSDYDVAYGRDGLTGGGRGSATFDGTTVLIDADGDGRAEEAITVEWARGLGADDFIF